MTRENALPIETQERAALEYFDTAPAAVERLIELYQRASTFLLDRFVATLRGGMPQARYRAFYPQLQAFARS